MMLLLLLMYMSDEKKAVNLTCKCGYSWAYKGKKKHNAQCPDCKTTVKIKE